jgi:hypothetical protein
MYFSKTNLVFTKRIFYLMTNLNNSQILKSNLSAKARLRQAGINETAMALIQ